MLYHETDVVTFHADGRTVLNSGGWRTYTTKERLSNYGPCYVCQSKGVWYCGEDSVPFADGITFHGNGKVTGQGEDPKREMKLRGQVQRYARKYIDALRAGKVLEPSTVLVG